MTITVVPANQARCRDLTTILGMRGSAAECLCQRYRLARGESFENTSVEARVERLRTQTACGDPASSQTSGLIAYLEGEAAGWCAVAPRASYQGLVRNSNQTAWRGRTENRTDPGIWAITCLFTRAGSRGRGVATALAGAAAGFARDCEARRLEAYPTTVPMAVQSEEHPGPLGVYLAAGFEVVHRPSERRAVVSLEL